MASTIIAGNTTNSGTAISSDNTGALEIKTGSGAGTTALTIDASQNVTAANNLVATGFTSASTFGFKNRIINGSMFFDQRNNGASVTPTVSGTYTLDRWASYITQSSKFSVQQREAQNTAASNYEAGSAPTGFKNSIKITSTSAYSVLSSDTFILAQGIEGQNLYDLAYGTASAASVTLSFWVKSSLTGTFGGGLYNALANYSYLFNYTINAAGTWEYKTVTIPGDTARNFYTTTTAGGLYLYLSLGAGSANSGTANTWQSGNLTQPTGSVSLVGTSGATLYFTGIQLEKGSTATSFDFRSVGTELQLCQRYYQIVGQTMTTTSQYSTVSYMQPMRVAPSIGPVTFDAGTGATFAVMNVTVGASLTKAYQNTNHSQIAQASIPLSAEF